MPAKNEHFYGADDVVYDRVEVTFLVEETTRMLEFEAGNFDVVYLSNSDNIDKLSSGSVEGAALYQGQPQTVTGFALNTMDMDTFSDIRVRQAIQYAIDVPTMVEVIRGSAYRPADPFLPSSNFAYKEQTKYAYEVETARSFMEEAGYSETNRFSFVARIMDADYNVVLAETIRVYLTEIYIDMDVQRGDFATIMGEVLADTIEFGATTSTGSYDPGGIVNARLSTAPAHLSQFADQEIVGKLMEAHACGLP